MKRITDERLKLEMFKNIRILFVFENLGLIVILIYQSFKDGLDTLVNSPFSILLMLTGTLAAFLQIRISADSEERKKDTSKPLRYYPVLIESLLTGGVAGLVLYLSNHERYPLDAALFGSSVFICFLLPLTISYALKKKHRNDNDK